MKLPNYKLVDSAFRHGESACHDRSPSHFRWQWLDPEDGYDFPDEPIFFTDRSIGKAKFYSAARKIAWILEPRAVQREQYDWIASHADEFDIVLTFDQELIDSNPRKFRYFAFGGCWIPDDQVSAYPKTKRCSIIASAKAVTEGQRFRHEVIEHLGDQVDVYGHGYQPVENKLEALRDYEMTIVIENCRQDDYFSEKLIDALATGTVPLYWGTSRIKEYFPEGVHSFETLDELKSMLVNVRPDPKEIAANLSRIENYKNPEDWIWEHHPDLFLVSESEPITVSISDFFNGGKRLIEKIRELKSRIRHLTQQRNKSRAERERLRAERDEARQERNTARAERDEALKALTLNKEGSEESPPTP